MQVEGRSLLRLMASPQSAALRHVFFAQRGVGKIEALAEKWLPEDSALRRSPPDRPCEEKLISLVSPQAQKSYPACDKKLLKAYQSLLGALLYLAMSKRGDC